VNGQTSAIEIRWKADYRSSADSIRAWLGWRAWLVRAVGLFLTLSVVATADDAGTMVLGVVEGLLFVTMPEWYAAVTWRMSRRLGRHYVNLIDDSGVTRRNEVNSSFLSWASFSRARRTHKYWILRAGRSLIVLPASEFSPEEEVRFRGYLKAAGLQ
jgi:hypothetical protein